MSNAAHLDIFIAESASKNPNILFKHFSPDVELYHKGQPRGKGLDKLTQIFVEQWTKEGAYEAKILEKRELPGQNAMQIKAEDNEDQTVVTTTYTYAEVAGQKLIVKVDTTYDF